MTTVVKRAGLQILDTPGILEVNSVPNKGRDDFIAIHSWEQQY